MEILGVSSLQNLQALSALLNPQEGQKEEEDYETLSASAQLGPGSIGPKPKKDTPAVSGSISKSKEIWSEEEVSEGSQFDDLNDQRPQPDYEVIMKQSVGTEDVFLGLSEKDPSSMSCEALLVKIKLPDTKLADVVLDVKETFLDLRTPKYKLGLHLPHPVHSQEGKAQFFSDREELEVTLLMNRPLDFINGK
ncbi:protein PIH1D3 [Boleophthalmus pectinirostris]|uniref:protein PIH1D3 n=1 Tax=Boleophthalmus pectinirostris TaxID=150288 RepID=UPI00242C7908|nr:protein PIH1D3 [Boleophthalmus pectinirostris]